MLAASGFVNICSYLHEHLLRVLESVHTPLATLNTKNKERQYQLISKQFDPDKPLVASPKPPRVKSSGPKKSNALKPIPTPEERALMLAKARNLDAKTRKLNS